jgi:hypothetical protein
MCKVCWFLRNPEKVAAVEPEPEAVEITEERLAETIRGLEHYMARRRQRIGAMA